MGFYHSDAGLGFRRGLGFGHELGLGSGDRTFERQACCATVAPIPTLSPPWNSYENRRQ